MTDRLRHMVERIARAGKVLNGVVSEAEVDAFERHHRIKLPEGFRRFLLEVGNGGEGPPYYNLVPLGQGPNSCALIEVKYWQELPDVHRPFPFTKLYVWESGDISEEGSPEQARHGSIFLGEDGCGMDWLLIVTGKERGNIWVVCGAGIAPTNPKMDFLSWYENWLDGMGNGFS